MAGPFAVSELRVTRALQDWGAKLPANGTQVYLTDTLEGPNTPPPALRFYLKPIAEQHAKALKVKAAVPVIVCLGNPPYDRTQGVDETNKGRTGHWVRWGDDGKCTAAIFKDFLAPALAAGHGVRVHNLYNLYVYFRRWALWKVFEHKTAAGPGVVSYISGNSGDTIPNSLWSLRAGAAVRGRTRPIIAPPAQGRRGREGGAGCAALGAQSAPHGDKPRGGGRGRREDAERARRGDAVTRSL